MHLFYFLKYVLYDKRNVHGTKNFKGQIGKNLKNKDV